MKKELIISGNLAQDHEFIYHCYKDMGPWMKEVIKKIK